MRYPSALGADLAANSQLIIVQAIIGKTILGAFDFGGHFGEIASLENGLWKEESYSRPSNQMQRKT